MKVAVGFRNAMFFWGTVVFFLWGMLPVVSQAEIQEDLSQCAAIEDDLLRLQCYDGMVNRVSPSVKAVEPVNHTDTCVVPAGTKSSYLSRLWELDRDQSRGKFAIRMHRTNYILPFSFNFDPNGAPIREAFPGRKVQKSEATFQLSFKTKLWEDIGGKNVDLWLGYTQRSFWQVYNVDQSAPFRETNYEPELLVNLPMDLNVLGMTLRTVNFGMNHQSNGRAEPLSRSWNRIVANLGFERTGLFSLDDSLVLELKSWYRIPEDTESDDNPDIEDYLGYGEIWASYFRNKNRFSMMVRNNLDDDENRGAIQLEWSFPLNNRISGYLLYYLGYGESLLDYNHSVNRVGLGFVLTDWD